MGERAPFWSDDFDADLLRVVPGVERELGDAAGIVLVTYSGTTHGRINLPSCWHTDRGLTAFFGTHADVRLIPDHYRTSHPRVACTWLEVLRDVWSHDYAVAVDGQGVLAEHAFHDAMFALMFHVRGQTPLADARVAALCADTLGQIARATETLSARVARGLRR